MNYRRIRIVRAGKAAPVDFAAKELTRYLKMADAALTVDELLVSENKEIEGHVLTLKVSKALAEELAVEDARYDDGYRISVKNDEGVIEGTNERSVLLGVYRFLRELGFAYVRPGVKGERIPAKLKEEYEINVCEKAEYRHRGVTIEGGISYENCRDMIDFLPKNGMNSYFFQLFVPTHYFGRWYWHQNNPCLEPEVLDPETVEGFVGCFEEEMKKRGVVYHKVGHGWTCEPFGIPGVVGMDPEKAEAAVPAEAREYLAQIDGQRKLFHGNALDTNLCYSNPAVRAQIADTMVKYCLDHKEVDVLHFWLADGTNNHCECENCRKKRPSDWYVQTLNELDEKMTTTGVTTRIVFLLYVDLLWEPLTEKVKNPDRFVLMFAPITRYYGVNYEDTKPYNEELKPYHRNHNEMPKGLGENLARLKGWQQYFPGDSFIFDYHLQWAHVSDPGYEFSAKNMFYDMKYLHQMGLNGNVSCQVNRCFFPSGIVMRAMGEALWGTKDSFEEMLTKYYRDSYGETGDAVRDYLGTISRLFTTYDKEGFVDDEEKGLIRPDDLKLVRDYDKLLKTVDDFLPVIEEGAQKGGQAAEDWKVLKVHAGYVKLLGTALHLKDQKDEAAALKAAGAVVDYICQHELEIQEAIDVHNIAGMIKNGSI